MMRSFRYAPPGTRVIFGEGCVDQLAAELRRSGCSRAMILSGRTLARTVPGVETLRSALGELYVGASDGVTEHSPAPSVVAIARKMKEADADAVIALGGGSAIVSARAASILYGEGKPVEDLCTVFEPGKPPRSPKLSAPKVPQFIVPTTPTTAFAKAGAAVSTGDAGRRLSLFDPKARAQAVLFDPAFFGATPAALFRDAALDAFGAAVQGLESRTRNPIADAMLLQAIRLMRKGLPRIAQGGDVELRGEVMVAALMVGQGTDVTAGGLASAIGHSVGARYSVANGIVNAIVLPHTLRFNADATGAGLGDLAEVLGLSKKAFEPAPRIADACAAFFAELGVPARLRDIGVARDDLPSICETAARDWFYTQNPRPVTPEDCLSTLEAAW